MKNASLILLLLAGSVGHAADSNKLEAHVAAGTKAVLLIDTHDDIASFTITGADIANAPKNHPDIPRLKQGRVGAVFFSVYVAATYVEGNPGANRTLQMIDGGQHGII